ncbi:MAG: hypothetical protein QOJ00_972 [Actinomycetota bacterium]
MLSKPRSLCVVALALVLGLLGASCKAGGHETAIKHRHRAAPTTTTAAPVQAAAVLPAGVPAPTKIALLATAKNATIALHPAPGSTAVVKTLANPTLEGMPLAMLAVDQAADWFEVRIPERPNGTTAWVRAADVDTTPVTNRIVISTSQRSLKVLDAAQQTIYETNVAVGKPSTPTPLGRFYVDIWLPNPGRPYGSFMLSIAGFSDVLKSFGGGRGQIAMHGWADPSVMGKNASNGCVRMRNGDISHLSELAPLGTPVEIIA